MLIKTGGGDFPVQQVEVVGDGSSYEWLIVGVVVPVVLAAIGWWLSHRRKQ